VSRTSRKQQWSWGESNPRPRWVHRPRYDHSRVCDLRPSRRRVDWGRDPTADAFVGVSGLSRRQRSFPAVHRCFCCRAAVIRPREPLLVPMTLMSPDYQAARATRWLPCLWLPRLRSLSNSGRTIRRTIQHVETDQPRGLGPGSAWDVKWRELGDVPARASRLPTQASGHRSIGLAVSFALGDGLTLVDESLAAG
jgi:hypothetical protein